MSIEGQGHCLTLAKGHSDFKIKTFFTETVGSFETKFYMKAYRRMGKKFYAKKKKTVESDVQDRQHVHIWLNI